MLFNNLSNSKELNDNVSKTNLKIIRIETDL